MAAVAAAFSLFLVLSSALVAFGQGEMAAAPNSGDDVVIKSPTDRRSYRLLHLPNGLCALLVHDPDIHPDGFQNCREHENEEEDEDEDEEDEEMDDEDESAMFSCPTQSWTEHSDLPTDSGPTIPLTPSNALGSTWAHCQWTKTVCSVHDLLKQQITIEDEPDDEDEENEMEDGDGSEAKRRRGEADFGAPTKKVAFFKLFRK